MDVHVPSVQRTIEEPWSRIYFGQGIRTSPSWRTFQVEWFRGRGEEPEYGSAIIEGYDTGCGGTPTSTATSAAATAVLPLPVDDVQTMSVVASGVTRIVLAHAAPRPVAVMAALAGPLTLIGVPGMAPLTLTPTMVRDVPTAGPNAFEIYNMELADAVAAAASDEDPIACAALISTVIPNDAALAKVLSCAITVALNSQCASTDCNVSKWRFALQYCGATAVDEFTVTYSAGGTPGGRGNAGGSAVFRAALPASTGFGTGPGLGSGPGTGYGPGFGTGPGGAIVGPAVSFRILPGPVASYMGFDGRALPADTPTRAPSGRVQPPCGFAQLVPARYAAPADLVTAVTASASAYTWPPFDLIFNAPGMTPQTIEFPGGHGTLAQVAWVLQGLITNALDPKVTPPPDIRVSVVGSETTICGTPACPAITGSGAAGSGSSCGASNGCASGCGSAELSEPRGLAFTSTASTPFAFSITFPSTPTHVAAALGYAPGTITPVLPSHGPTAGYGAHVPQWDLCCGEIPFVPVANVQAALTPAGALSLTSVPFTFAAPVQATENPSNCMIETEALTTLPVLRMTVTSTTGELLGLSPGMVVALVAATTTSPQVRFVVAAMDTASNVVTLYQMDGTQAFAVEPTAGTQFIMVSLTAPPLTLYMQTPGGRVTRGGGVPPAIFGFSPQTYFCDSDGAFSGYATTLTSPGLVRVGHDPYLLLCLGFSAADTAGLAGDIYYPMQVPSGTSSLVFASIQRAACDWRPEYVRTFFKTFPGAGMHLGYVRVRILNADGRPYLTHGHPVSIMLRADIRTDTPQIGGPGHYTPIPPMCMPAAGVAGNGTQQSQQTQQQPQPQQPGCGAGTWWPSALLEGARGGFM
jgi:hypothetical protein